MSARNFAFVTVLIRDIFGYLFIGVAFWALLLWLGKIPFVEDLSDVRSGVLVLVLGYPVGRLLFYVGNGLRLIVPRLSFERLIPKKFDEFKDAHMPDGFEPMPLGIPFTSKNSEILCGRLLPRKMFVESPDLYFLYIARTNTLRLMSETFLGLICVGSLIYLAHGDNATVWWKSLICIIVFAAGVWSVALSRNSQARTEVVTSYFYLAQLEEQRNFSQSAPGTPGGEISDPAAEADG